MYSMRRASTIATTNVTTETPPVEEAIAFEREILNARINFIYFVTVQKPGALDAGWVRYRNAQGHFDRLVELVDQHPELSSLAPS